MASLAMYEKALRAALDDDDPIEFLELMAKKSISDDLKGTNQSFHDTMIASLAVLAVALEKSQK